MVVSMSEKEFSRLSVLMDAQAGRLRIDDAARLLELKRRQIFRLLKGLRTDGAASLASKRRGRTSNNKLPDAVPISGQPWRRKSSARTMPAWCRGRRCANG